MLKLRRHHRTCICNILCIRVELWQAGRAFRLKQDGCDIGAKMPQHVLTSSLKEFRAGMLCPKVNCPDLKIGTSEGEEVGFYREDWTKCACEDCGWDEEFPNIGDDILYPTEPRRTLSSHAEASELLPCSPETVYVSAQV